ncbi:MAG: cobalamin-dependent protein [Lentisphaerae bacterium]|nr:cobalamin-dependent protein [Lentisphaerota bacterium]
MELFHNQITKVQGIASLRFHHRSFGLYFLAENVNADVTVLDFPSRRRFIRELRKGYDIVGISFIAPNFSKAREMARLVREHSKKSVILIGGHGAAIENIEDLIPCDHVVRGEGIGWLRSYLGEDPEAPIRHPNMPSNDYHRVYGIPMPGITAGLLVPGVGCDNGCRFCSTTHFFGKAYKPFVSSGKDLFGSNSTSSPPQTQCPSSVSRIWRVSAYTCSGSESNPKPVRYFQKMKELTTPH